MKLIKPLLCINLLLIPIISVISISANGQTNYLQQQTANIYLKEKGEVYFKFEITDKALINTLSTVVSIDKISNREVYAYANYSEFINFLGYNIPYTILLHPGNVDFDVRMTDEPSKILEWDYYPTYDGYVTLMNQFASNFTNLCQIVNAGSTVQGRAILFAKISDNVSSQEPEPKFMYTSTMHGDETAGYVLMLRLIDYLLTNYNTDPKVTQLVNNIEIWINPLANPDGTYRAGNHTVNGATRYNANNRDLNRNFPDPTNPNPTPPFQPETIVMMNLADANYFSLSANFHGGVEVVNYPWDTWARLTADNDWWVSVSRQYADTVHRYAISGYMTYLNNGITNGYAWYRVIGGRQDYMCYYKRGRECTIELSNQKLLNPTQLPAHWNYNWHSFLYYMEKVLYGINGTVTDSFTVLPLMAKVTISGFDIDSSEVFSEPAFGKYYRMIYGGTYNVTFSAPNYYSKTIQNVYVKNDSTTILNVQLVPNTTGLENNYVIRGFQLYQNYPNPFNPKTNIKFALPKISNAKLTIYDALGREVALLVNEGLKAGTYQADWDGSNYPSGVYYYQLTAGEFRVTRKMVLIK